MVILLLLVIGALIFGFAPYLPDNLHQKRNTNFAFIRVQSALLVQ